MSNQHPSAHRRPRRAPSRTQVLLVALPVVVATAGGAYAFSAFGSEAPGGKQRSVAVGAESTPTLVPSTAKPSAKPSTGPSTAEPRATRSAATKPKSAATPQVSNGSCAVASADSIWRRKVNSLPVHPKSSAYVMSIGASSHVHPDFGSGEWDGKPFGIPITELKSGQAPVSVSFHYADESDRGPYPIPPNARIEGGPRGGGDRHVIAWDKSACKVYELYDAHRRSNRHWTAQSGAIFNLWSDKLRPQGWTSADAAGLPILPGLARYDEASTGTITHALRITVPRSQSAHLWPARHDASDSSNRSLPPMGLRLRLKASTNISGLPPQARAVAQALKTYGAIVADNGSAWYISGTQDTRWNNEQLNALKNLRGSDFEAVDVSRLQISPNSGAAR
ncbi:hypothetical protein [Streptomyces sp. NPDC054794]